MGSFALTEFKRRLMARPAIAMELVLASFLANVLALASPLFVIQVLNRYVAYGVDATLATLTFGVVSAILLEFGFRIARMRLATAITAAPDEQMSIGAFGALNTAKASALDTLPPGQRVEILRGLDQVESAHNAPNINAILDVPFAFLFCGVLALMSGMLAAIVLFFMLLVFLVSVYGQTSLREPTQKLTEASVTGNALITSANTASDAVRVFNGVATLMKGWAQYVNHVQTLRRFIASRNGLVQTVTQNAQAMMSVAIVSVGAIYVVNGELDVGAMIGANILAARALAPIGRFAQMGETLIKARNALTEARSLAELETQSETGTRLNSYKGGVEFRDMAFGYKGAATPLVESLTHKIEPGSIVVIAGQNGTGKTTMARLLAGLLEPTRGQILVDGVDLRQVAPTWWYQQIMYLPQEPKFLNTTLRDNLSSANPSLNDRQLHVCLERAGLAEFIDRSEAGLDTPIDANGFNLSLGHRRRIAIARALATNGPLVIFDEPTEALDSDGRRAVYQVLKTLANERKTVICLTNDQNLLKGASQIIDLNQKPTPRILNNSAAARPAASKAAS